MARSPSCRAAVVALLLACLAVSAMAQRRSPRRPRHASEDEAEELDMMEVQLAEEEKGGVYDCPDVPKMRACAPAGCVLHTHRRASYLICNECRDEEAYVLVHSGTRKAACECAPGFAGRGQDGQCKKCPAGTDIAAGGPIRTSVCLRCPKGSIVSEDGADCMCPAGTYRATADQPAGHMRIACKACEARNAYVSDELHTKDSCSSCKMPLLANKDHTECVAPTSPDAAEMPEGLLKSVAQRANETFGGLASAFEEGRQMGQEKRLMRIEGREDRPANMFKQLTKRVSSLRATVEEKLGGKAAKKGARGAEQEGAEEEEVKEQGRAEEEEGEGAEDDGAELSNVVHKRAGYRYDADEEKRAAKGRKGAKGGSAKKKHAGEEEEDKKEKEDKAKEGKKKHAAEEEEEYEEEEKEHKPKEGKKKHYKEEEEEKEKEHKKEEEHGKEGYEKEEKERPHKHADEEEDKEHKEEEKEEEHAHGKKEGSSKHHKEEDKEEEDKEDKKGGAKKGYGGSSKRREEQQKKREEKREAYKEAVVERKEAKAEVKREVQLNKVDPNLAQKLIPTMPAEPEGAEQKQQQQPGAAGGGSPSGGPSSLLDMAKQLGAQLGAVAPSRDYIGNMLGKIDPSALEDAGLPPVNNVGSLMGAIIKHQFNDLDTSDWSGGLKSLGSA